MSVQNRSPERAGQAMGWVWTGWSLSSSLALLHTGWVATSLSPSFWLVWVWQAGLCMKGPGQGKPVWSAQWVAARVLCCSQNDKLGIFLGLTVEGHPAHAVKFHVSWKCTESSEEVVQIHQLWGEFTTLYEPTTFTKGNVIPHRTEQTVQNLKHSWVEIHWNWEPILAFWMHSDCRTFHKHHSDCKG